jgi:hypothetical protein
MERSTRLAASLRYSLYAASAMVFASGALWLAAHYLLASRPLADGLAAASMRVHGGAAMVLLVLIGWTVALHAPGAWREQKNLVSGISLSATLVVLTATSYCLYYLGNESARAISSLGHWVLGLALPAALACHVWLGRRNHLRDTALAIDRDSREGSSMTTSPSDVAAAPEENPGNATQASGSRR